MKILKTGVPAIEGVEAAIKVLEDQEITNSGFGSNLALDGTVECDATLVDHFGRSGACGAVPSMLSPRAAWRSATDMFLSRYQEPDKPSQDDSREK
jgi:taspase (threonine aspartase 1)